MYMYAAHGVAPRKECVMEGGWGQANYVSNPTKLSLKKQAFGRVDASSATNFHVSNPVPPPNSKNAVQAALWKTYIELVCAGDKGSMTQPCSRMDTQMAL